MIYYRKTLFGCGPKLTAVQYDKYKFDDFKIRLKIHAF